MDENPRRDEPENAPEVGEESPGGDIAGPGDGPPTEERPEHVRPTSETQESTRFVGAPEGED